MARRVLVTGASGLVGTWLRRLAPRDIELVSVVHRTPVSDDRSVLVDLREEARVVDAIDRIRPALVIHAAMAMDEPSIVGATANVARAASSAGVEVVHVSTDAVFSGDGRPVDEGDPPDPVIDYGRWKATAERLVLQASPTSAIVRLPLVVSLDPDDQAVRKVRRGAEVGERSRWFSDELRRPAMAADIAAGLWAIAALDPSERAGPWHLIGFETLSRYQIALRIAAVLGLDPSAVEAERTPPDLVRPHHLELRSERARLAIGWNPSPILI